MILAIDIGNMTTNFGVFERGRLKSQFSIATQSWRTPDEVTLQLKALAKIRHLHLTKSKQIIICSVVPRMAAVMIEALKSLEAVPIHIIGQDIKVPLKNRYKYPEQVGQDRLVGAYAAWHPTKKTCIIVDFGTAITIDIVNRKGEYLGGIIAPGLDISLEALVSKTALLPKIELGEPPELLGRDTANSIRSGLVYGSAAMCDGLIFSLKNKYAKDAKVTATGGSVKMITSHCKSIDYVKPHLVLEGLCKLSQLTSSKNISKMI